MSVVNFEEIEILAYSRLTNSNADLNKFLRDLLKVLAHMHAENKLDWKRDEDSISFHCTRMAAVLNRVFLDDSIVFNDQMFIAFASCSEAIEAIYQSSGYRGMNHIFDYFFVTKKDKLTQNHVRKLYSILTVRNVRNSVLFNFPKVPLNFSFIAALSLIGNRAHSMTPQRAANYQYSVNFLNNLGALKLAECPSIILALLVPAYMYSTYAMKEDKHKVKGFINNIVREYLGKEQIQLDLPDNFETKTKNGKEVVLIISDIFTKTHAMTRCLMTFINGLKENFYLVLVYGESGTDETTYEHFDECIEFEHKEGKVAPNINKLRNFGARMAYFPSIGMSVSSLVLSNLRIAPIQSFTLGHPATTKSDYIDYALIEKFTYVKPLDFSEKIVIRNEGLTSFTKHPLYGEIKRKEPKDSETVIIGVASKITKINHEFLQNCKNIVESANKKVIFHFFPNMVPPYYNQITSEIKSILPQSEVFEGEGYMKYLELLNDCDFFVSTFPFGNTNGNVDALMLGKPIVVRYGEEICSYIDVGFIKELELPDWLICQDSEDFVSTCVKMTDDFEARKEVCEIIKEAKAEDTFFAIENGTQEGLSQKTLEWVMENHTKLKASKKKEFYLGQKIS